MSKVDIKAQLEKGHSRAITAKIVSYVGSDSSRFSELMNIFLKGPYRITQRAAWPVSYCVEAYPELVKPWLPKLLTNLKKPGISDAVKRNTVRLMQFICIPNKLQGRVVDICMKFLQDGNETIAVRVFSMTVLGNICKDFPDLKEELKLIIEDQMPYSSAGFNSRGKKVLKQISKY